MLGAAGGTIVIACWCQREETAETPLTHEEKDKLQFLYDEWAHPYFISNLEFGRLMEVCITLCGIMQALSIPCVCVTNVQKQWYVDHTRPRLANMAHFIVSKVCIVFVYNVQDQHKVEQSCHDCVGIGTLTIVVVYRVLASFKVLK